MPDAALLESPIAEAEFLAVDTETNGQPRDRCELTEVGAVLVGGGELHDRWSSLVGVSEPLGRGIQRFTGITQAMVDEAPPPASVLPELARQLDGRIFVAHSARFDVGVLRQAFERAELDWPDPPVICTVALARRFAPLQRRRGLASLADALGIEVGETHRALPDAETCARVLCALLPRLCANARTIGEALALLRPRKPPRYKPVGAKRPRDERPDLSALPKDPGVYIFRDADGRPLYVGKSICLRTRARAHFTTPATWTGQAEHVDYQPTESELGALVLENRLIKALKPPGNTLLKKDPDGYVYLRCRLDIPFPILEVAREPAAGHAVCIGPVRGRAAAAELVEQLNSLFGLRHCGRALARRPHPSAYGQMGRCLSPCLGDLDPNLYRERLDEALRLFEVDGASALLAHVDGQMRAAAAAERFERAAWLRRRARRLESLLNRLGGVLRAAHAGARLVVVPHPAAEARADAFWIVGGRIADWGPLPPDQDELAARTATALAAAPARSLGGWLPADELDEMRIVGMWVAGHDEARVLELDPPPDARAFAAISASPKDDRPTRARRAARAARARAPALGS
ncbi:MAG TPA: exonuclease domain-containing protein [Solirubrobacteraceae bacterium]|nr:exonuclease domain-containing protein [Solirubrobacteraceae bacterium]